VYSEGDRLKMARHRVKKQYINLPPPPRTPNRCAYEAGAIVAYLVRKHNARKWQVHYLIGMLHESYLLSLPRLKKDKSAIGDTSPQRLRWLWCSWGAKILGWGARRPEGHPDGFSVEVYTALRQKVFPFPKVERDAAGRPVEVDSTLPCTCSRSAQTYVNPFARTQAAIRVGWLEFFRYKGLIDEHDAIIWSADPKSNLSAWAYGKLLAVTGASNLPPPGEASTIAANDFRMGEAIAAGEHGSGIILPDCRVEGYTSTRSRRVADIAPGQVPSAERVLPAVCAAEATARQLQHQLRSEGRGCMDN
jgi:hypothetical protein